jgi:hypothetical protein
VLGVSEGEAEQKEGRGKKEKTPEEIMESN